jgi:TRAP-type transport system periplasmic protein
MRKNLILLLSLIMFLTVGAAGSWAAEQFVFSTMFPNSYTYLLKPAEDFCEKVEKLSNGELKFDFYHSAQLYGGKEEFAAVSRGEVDFSIPHDTYHTGEVPELGITSLPFLFNDLDQAMYMLDIGLKDMIAPILEEKQNCILLGWAAVDPYQLYSKDPINTIEDIKGKVWAISGTPAAKAIEQIGGSTTMMSSGELYLALQTGTIDGALRPLLTGVGRKLDEVADYLTLVPRFQAWGDMLVMNKDKWDRLTEEQQEILKKAARDWEYQVYYMSKMYIQDAVKTLVDRGMNVSYLSEEEMGKFTEAMEPVFEWWITEEVPDGQKYIDFVEENR